MNAVFSPGFFEGIMGQKKGREKKKCNLRGKGREEVIGKNIC